MDEMMTAFAGLSDDEIIARVRFGLPVELRRPAPACFGSPLGRRRCFVRRGARLVEVWSLGDSLFTDGDAVFEVEPGRLFPGTL